MPKLNMRRWSVRTAQVVYENSFDEESGVFDVTIAASVIRDAGDDLCEMYMASWLIGKAGTDKGDSP